MRAVNERRGPGTPEASRVLHTVVGIDRYPNYLQRFSPAELSQLEELFKKYAEQCAQAKAGTTYFGGRGVIFVDDLGAGWLLDLLLLVANVIAARLFPRDTGLREGSSSAPNEGMLDWRHGFILKSTASHASSARPLVPHTDDAELTMNACLGRNFEGGEILLGGLRGTDDEHRDLNCAADCYVPQPWRALIHLGRRLHAVKQLQQGERRALIVWFRSLRAVRSGVCPCCLLNRRHDGKQGDCISGSRWNRPNDPSAAGVS
mmetsp:Transcript_632/g.1311  ORF Transcript_632/g.1311 Transcript_632/m.1311 type:complete len:261 (-) Transcript_632:395-1177(-)